MASKKDGFKNSSEDYLDYAVDLLNNSVSNYHGFMTNTTRDRMMEREKQAANYLSDVYLERMSHSNAVTLAEKRSELNVTELEEEYALRNELAYEQATYTDQVNAAKANYEAALALYNYQLEHNKDIAKTGSNIIVEGAKALFKLVTK